MGFVQTLIVSILYLFTSLYDIVTILFYALYYKPWANRDANKENKAEIVSTEGGGITYHTLKKSGALHKDLENGKIDTMEKIYSYAVKKHGPKRCLGTREMIDEEDELQSNNRVFKKYVLGDYIWKSYNEIDQLAVYFGKGMRELGLEPKGRVAIFAETRAEWFIAALAAFKQNYTIVTIYATLGDDAITHALNETEVEYLITSHDLLPKFKNILLKTPAIHTVVYMEDPLKKTDIKGYKDNVTIESYCDVVKMGSRSGKGLSSPSPTDIAIIMYTSGSTGTPKGVLLSHANIVTALMSFSDVLNLSSKDICISFLPLAHVLELVCESICFIMGCPVGYSTPLTMTDKSSKIKRGCKGDCSVLHPTIMASVPLILDRIYKGIQENVEASGETGKAVFKFFYNYKLKWTKRGYETPLLNKLIFEKTRALLGGKVRLLASGGAPLSPETHEFIRTSLCVPVLQGYGLTETCACATLTLTSDLQTGRAGGPLGCCDLRLVDWEEGNYRTKDKPYPRGEVLIGGENVSMGYFKLPSQTKEEFFIENGKRWFRTGDIGEMHKDGVLKIIDRKKDLVKLQFGEYVSLGKVESELKTCTIVENICIYGDSSKLFTVALVVPSAKHLEAIAKKLNRDGVSLEKMCEDKEIEKEVLKEIQEHGKKSKLEKFEIPSQLKLVTDIWTPESEMVTAAFKLKRKNIQEKYQGDINRMYSA